MQALSLRLLAIVEHILYEPFVFGPEEQHSAHRHEEDQEVGSKNNDGLRLLPEAAAD